MKKALVIVESPTKIKTLKKFLGKEYTFASSVGHVRDLPPKKFGIKVDDGFEPEYEILENKKDVIATLKKEAKQVEVVYLAPDPDREGEAIAWHISQILPKGTKFKRVTFNAITKAAVQEALNTPRDINLSLVDAQQARRLLDRIVGYKISPILHRKVQKGRDGFLSAGRVQSVALKLVVDREREILAFIPVEYWNINALLQKNKDSKAFSSYLYSVEGKKVEKEKVEGKECFLIPDQKTAEEIEGKLKKAKYTISKVEKKEKKRNPVAPFITSTLQQEASRHFGFSAQRTMGIAQSLYEGVDLGGGSYEGLITYMRTDSVRIAPEAQKEAQAFIRKEYGKEYLPAKPPVYSTKKAAQDAHEAIRPSSVKYTPTEIKNRLSIDQFKIYDLIWKRLVASQMNPAIYDTVTCHIDTDQGLQLRANGSLIKFRGFLIVYEEKNDQDDEISVEDKDKLLPELEAGQNLNLVETQISQSFTRPPPRFTEASLVKELEKSGIGRPSTYATIMNKIHSKEYTNKEKNTIWPTELGFIICQMLEQNFSRIMDIGFTARMEDKLDKIAEGDRDWKSYIEGFWKKFIPEVEIAEKEAHVPRLPTDRNCPKCGAMLEKIWARKKYFYGCSKYPDCDYTAPLEELELNKDDYAEDFDWDQPCPKCGGEMRVRSGRFGVFFGCIKYPKCNGIVNIPKKGEQHPEELPACPAQGCPGRLTQKRSRFGKPFFACSTYPECDVIGNEVPDILEKFADHPRTKAPARKSRSKSGKTVKSAKGRAQPLYKLSDTLVDIVKDKELTRGDITKKLWVYIKEHDLQDEKNRRLIVPDAKLEKLFGSKEPLDMMQLARVISKHIE